MRLNKGHHSLIIFLLIAHAYLGVSQIPNVIMAMRTPPNQYWTYTHGYIEDYNNYLAVITQGANGAWRMRDAYTTEPTKPTFFYFFYILVGKVSSLFHLSPVVAYHLARLVSLEYFFLILYLFTQRLLGTTAGFWAAVFAIVGTIAPFPLYQDSQALVAYMPWWSQLEALRRLDWMPHYLFGFALLCTCALGIINFFRRPTWRLLLPLILATFLLGLIFSPGELPIFFGGAFAGAVLVVKRLVFRKQVQTISWKAIIGLILVIAAALAALLILRQERYNGPPWTDWYIQDLTWWKNTVRYDREFLLTFGSLFIFSLPGAVYALYTGTFAYLFIVSWAYLPYILLPLANTVGFGVYRLATTAHFVPLAILTSLTIHKLVPKRLWSWRLILILLFIAVSVPVSVSQAIRGVKEAQTFPLYQNLYPSKATWSAISYLKSVALKNARILSSNYNGSMIPAYMPVISYFGPTYLTLNFDEKSITVEQFFRNAMTDKESVNFLRTNGINFVFFGEIERQYGADTLHYPNLIPVFQEDNVTVYKVTQIP